MINWNKELTKKMQEHAIEAYPYECCGFILGSRNQDKDSAIDIIPADNTHKGEKRRRFFIDPLSYMKAEKEAEKRKLDLIGVYHSHPDHPAKPSEEDRKHALSGFHYPIISVMKGKETSIKSWLLESNRLFIEETIIENN